MSTPHGTGDPSGEAAQRHLQATAHRHLWLHFTRMSSYAEGDMPVIVRGSGQYVYDNRGKRYLDGLSGLFVSQIGHGRRRGGRGRRAPGRGTRLLPALVVRAPAGDRAGRTAGGAGAGRPEPRLLHHQRLRGGRVRLEAGQAVLQDDRPARAVQGAQPRHRLPRHVHGGARDHRAPRHQGAVRADGARRGAGAEHQLLPGTGLRRRATGRRSAGGRRTRSGGRSSGRARTRSRPCSWSRCRTRAAASRPRPGTSPGCGRSATSTGCCWSPTRSSARSAGWATTSARSVMATSRTSSPLPRA